MNNRTSASTFPWREHYDPGVRHNIELPHAPLYSLVDWAAEKKPEGLACIFHDFRMTYAEMQRISETIAANLLAHGLKQGDRVALMLPNLPQTYLAFWGILKAGGVLVMVNPVYMKTELRHLLTDSGARFMIAHDPAWKKIAPLRDEVPVEKFFLTALDDAGALPVAVKGRAGEKGVLPEIPTDDANVLRFLSLTHGTERYSAPVNNPAEDMAILQYTGGTTGVPKGVVLTHVNLLVNTLQTCDWLGSMKDEENVVAALLPLFHVYGLQVALLVPAAFAAAALPIPRYDPGEFLRLLITHGVTLFPGAPSVYLSLLQHKETKNYDLSSLKIAISGSAPIPAEAFLLFEELTGSKLIEGYGLTESSPITHLTPAYGKRKFGSIGLPIPNTEAMIVDMELGIIELPPNKLGELIVRGPQVMREYYNHPDETAGALRNGWLYTGDIGYMDEEGFFYIKDRKKDMVIVGGYNVYPREIDEVLLAHPDVKEAVAAAVVHPTRGEVLKAYVVLKEGKTLTTVDILSHCRKKLAKYKVPRVVEFRESLPRAVTGKILRRALQAEEADRAAGRIPDNQE
jgi:Acyl-CoA synthetases (AMP-forming)/AMP-acid ligases II